MATGSSNKNCTKSSQSGPSEQKDWDDVPGGDGGALTDYGTVELGPGTAGNISESKWAYQGFAAGQFSIPADATILGIKFNGKYHAQNLEDPELTDDSRAEDCNAHAILKWSGSQRGTQQDTGVPAGWFTGSAQTYAWGGENSLWGATLTPAILNGAWGADVMVTAESHPTRFYLDIGANATVYYSTPDGGVQEQTRSSTANRRRRLGRP